MYVYRAVTTTQCQSWTLYCHCLSLSSTSLVYTRLHYHHRRRRHCLWTSCVTWNSWFSTYMHCSYLHHRCNLLAVSSNVDISSRHPLSDTVCTVSVVVVLVVIVVVVVVRILVVVVDILIFRRHRTVHCECGVNRQRYLKTVFITATWLLLQFLCSCVWGIHGMFLKSSKCCWPCLTLI